MTNLFSPFDPTTLNNLSMNWTILLVIAILMPCIFWLIPSCSNFLWNILTTKLNKELKMNMKTNKTSTLLFISLFMFIFANNLISLFPYIFPSTSNISTNLSMALPLWMGMMMFGWINNTKHMLAHLIPMGTPPALMSFMVCIETISNLIRPGTLTIRLTTNLIAGHLMITLLSSSPINYYIMTAWLSILAQTMLLILELAVSIIQAYAFVTLIILYSSEID